MLPEIKISISKEQVAKLPIVAFKGEITLVDSPEQAAEAVADLSNHKVIGFDTETKPSFQKGKVNKMALIQLSTESHCYLFRINHMGIPPELSSLIENDDILKIGLSIHDDFTVMHRSSEIQPSGFLELQNYVKQFHINDISLQKIYAIVFGEKISKSQRLTNWEARKLSPQQQVYAATDAWACLKIYNQLSTGLFEPEKSQYLVTEEPELPANPAPEAAPSTETKPE